MVFAFLKNYFNFGYRDLNRRKFFSNFNWNFKSELDQFASHVLFEVREHDWIKERCLNEGDNLLKANQLLEPTLGRRAQNLLHIIFYPPTHHLRKQNEPSAKDFIKNILENLDLWSLRESLLEFKLMFELEKQKDNRYHVCIHFNQQKNSKSQLILFNFRIILSSV